MKYIAWALVIVVVLVGAVMGYAYAGAHLQYEGVRVEVMPAQEQRTLYDTTRNAISLDSFTGVQFQKSDLLMPESYQWMTYTVRLSNKGVLPAEWLRIEVRPDASDVLQLGEERGFTLAAGGKGDLRGTMLTRVGAKQARMLHITYYVMGRAYSLDIDMGAV
ncbi:MAG: hypothetical protein RR482_02505 [Clostridia bacterium]